MGDHLIEKRYELHRGLNPRKTDLTRPMEFASGMLNAEYTWNGSPQKRGGFQTHALSAGGYGTFLYERVDPTTELETPQVLSVDANLHLLSETTITVTYVGASPTAQLTFFYDLDTSQYRFQLNDAGVSVLDLACGIGFEEASTVTIADLVTDINLTSNFTATTTGATTTPAAFLKIVRASDLSSTGAPWTGVCKYWTQVNCPTTNPFATYITKKNLVNFENVSAVVLSNVLYISNGYDEVYKYDGQTFYRAGLPTPGSISSALGAAGNPVGSNYFHQMQYAQEDAAGQIIEGNLLSVTTGLTAASERMTVTVANILASTGFNTNCAIVAGAQVAVNIITVDNGSGGTHTMKVGDTAYFYDSVAAAYVTRAVTAIAATTITVAGAAVTVADNAVISNNLRINIWRNKTSAVTPQTFYLVDEIPNNSFAATQDFSDNLADASLGALLLTPLSDRSPPSKGKYLAVFQNSLVIAGSISFQNRVYWNDPDGPEYFPSDTNQQDAQTAAGDGIVGIGTSGTVMGILTKNCTFVLSGTLGDNSVRIDQRANDIGCEAHASIIQIKGVMAWWSARGPYAMVNGQIPVPIGQTQDASGNIAGRIEPIMHQEGLLPSQTWRTKRITAINWIVNQQAIWYLPAETRPAGSDIYPNSNSRVYVYDYDQDAWLEWSNLNMAGGAAILGDEFYFHERRYSSYATAVRFNLYRMHNLNDGWDFQDNTIPIDWEYAMGWEALGQPSVLKKYIQVKVFALEDVPNNEFTMQVDQEMNYQVDASVATFDIAFSGVGYGVSEYGTNPYGDSLEGSLRHDLRRDRCRSMRLRFSDNTAQTNCLFTGIEYLVSAPYRKEFKV